jgi:hypothetical protein
MPTNVGQRQIKREMTREDKTTTKWTVSTVTTQYSL